MADSVTLRGITWNHSRGYTPMAATAQRFSELNPGVEIIWEKRSLQAFADQPVGLLAETYDLLVLDHPWAGFAARTGVILPLHGLFSSGFLEDQRANSVGASYASYSQDGRQWALAIDAATPVASYRPDLLEQHGLAPPRTWDDVLALARKKWVTMSGIAIDSLMHFYMMCCALGEEPFQTQERVISPETGARALRMLRELAELLDPEAFLRNPIRVYEAMTEGDDCAYCPFAYGYSNYCRRGYARRRLVFDDLVSLGGRPLRSTLGGAGLAISARSAHPEIAARYAEFVASPRIQSTLYTDSGGQPGHRSAWEDGGVNNSTGDFFRNTLPALDRAFLRPRYHGHMHFQDNAGAPVRDYLMRGGEEEALLQRLDRLYRESLEQSTS
jgi:multiple sugar transport system substrate-binding protein